MVKLNIVNTYQPRNDGAKCDECPLASARMRPVRSVLHRDALQAPRGIIIAEAPGIAETASGEAMNSPTGKFADGLFKIWDTSIHHYVKINALSCSIKSGMKPKEIKEAVRCCRPRVEKEIRNTYLKFPKLSNKVHLVFGKYALYCTTGEDSIFNWAGATKVPPYPAKKGKEHMLGMFVFPCLHPASVMPHRQPEYKREVVNFIGRWLDINEFRLKSWDWGTELVEVNQEMFDGLKYLNAQPKIASDCETSGLYDAITGWHKKEWQPLALLDWGFADDKVSVVVPLQEITQRITLHRDPLSYRILALIKKMLGTKHIIGQNWYYDEFVGRYLLGVHCPMKDDTIIAASMIYPQQRKDLGWQSVRVNHAPRWKTSFKMTGDLGGKRYIKADARERQIYCGRDCKQTFNVMVKYETQFDSVPTSRERYKTYKRLHKIAVGMRVRGSGVDWKKRGELREVLAERMDKQKAILTRIAKAGGIDSLLMTENGKEVEFNPLNVNHLRVVMCDILNEEPVKYTAKGKPSYDANVMLVYMASKDKMVREVATRTLDLRKTAKLDATYLEWPSTKIHIEVGEVLSIDKNGKIEFECAVNRNTHPWWIPWRTKTGRWAGSRMLIPKAKKNKKGEVIYPGMRGMTIGRRLVSAYEKEILVSDET